MGVGVLLVFLSFMLGQQLDPVQARLQQISVRPRTLEELELQRPISERTIKPIVQGISHLISRFYPANTARSLQIRLKRAGMETTSVEFFLGVKGFAAILGALGGAAPADPISSAGPFTGGGLLGGIIVAFPAPAISVTTEPSGRAHPHLRRPAQAPD